MCIKKQYIDKESFFPKSKERLGRKNKRFLTILLSYNINTYGLNEMNGKREGRESVDKFTCLRGISFY